MESPTTHQLQVQLHSSGYGHARCGRLSKRQQTRVERLCSDVYLIHRFARQSRSSEVTPTL